MTDENDKLITVSNGGDQDVHVHGHGNLRAHSEAAVPDSEPVQQMIKDDVLSRHNRKPRSSADEKGERA